MQHIFIDVTSSYCRWMRKNQPNKPIKTASFSFTLYLLIQQMIYLMWLTLHSMCTFDQHMHLWRKNNLFVCFFFFFAFYGFTGTKNKPQTSNRGMKQVSDGRVWVWCPKLLSFIFLLSSAQKQKIYWRKNKIIKQVSMRA